MTASGITHVETPIAGLVDLALRDPSLQELGRRAADKPVDLAVVGPASARVYVACALAQAGPLLVVTATGREADDLTAELRGVLGDAVAMFPSWETLPHERLSPGVDTVGARMMLLRRLAHPDDERLGPPLRVVVTTTRSLLQPMAPDVADIEPVTLTVGAEAEFDDVITCLVELAYTRVDMVGKRGEFAVRGGILDVFPPTAEHPVRIEFWGDEVSEMRMFSVADQRSIPEIDIDTLIAVPCREVLLTDDVRDRAAKLATRASGAGEQRARQRARHAGQAGRGHPRRRHGGAAAAAAPHRVGHAVGAPAVGHSAADLRPREGPHPRGRPDQDRPGVPGGVLVDGGGGRRRADRHRGDGRIGIHRTRRRAGRGPRRRSPLVDAEPAERRVRAGGQHPPCAVGARQAEQRRRDLRDAARARRDGRLRGGRHPRHRHRAPRRRAARRIRHARNDVGARRRPEGGRRRGAQGPAARRCGGVRGQPRGDHRDRSDRQPGHRDRGQAAGRQAPQRGRPACADGRRPGGARPARHRPVRRDDRARGRRRAPRVPGVGVRVEQARRRVGPAVRADGFAGSAVALRRRRVADAVAARRQRLGQHEDQGPPGRP